MIDGVIHTPLSVFPGEKGSVLRAMRKDDDGYNGFGEAHLAAEKILSPQADNVSVIIIRCSNSFGIPYFENEKCWKLVVNDLCKSAFQSQSHSH